MDKYKVRLGKELLKRNYAKYCFIKITMKLLILFIYSLPFLKKADGNLYLESNVMHKNEKTKNPVQNEKKK